MICEDEINLMVEVCSRLPLRVCSPSPPPPIKEFREEIYEAHISPHMT